MGYINKGYTMNKRVIITGSTGMVGKGVLLECLNHKNIDSVLTINRTPLKLSHPKLKEVIHKDFYNFQSIETLFKDYHACFHCMGVSSFGLTESEYFNYTYVITKSLAKSLYSTNKSIILTYVSGTGTDSSESGKLMWARIKGKTENMLLNYNFSSTYLFRPNIIIPEKNVKPKVFWINLIYTLLKPFFPILKKFSSITTSSRLGLAMISCLTASPNKIILHNKDINQLARSFSNSNEDL